ncbi:MAG: MotA/TolQ/ExbB proton channel family protein [Victivallaceae bacterium]|nr:MotA/TolQ/ExbB proton channel family protein [Victivallaceae bacterium]
MTNLLIIAASSPGIYYAYQNSDGVGQFIVLGLLGGSVLAWTIMLNKFLSLHRAKKMSRMFFTSFENACDNKLNIASPSLRRDADGMFGPTASIYQKGVEKLLEFYHPDNQIPVPGQPATITPALLSKAQFDAIEAVLEQEVSTQIRNIEKGVGWMATMVSLAPFCGLFGTVWGVMMAFCGIAAAGKSDFTALAPGVAGALLTTVAGLVVAIPSLLGYNWMTGTVRDVTVYMDHFVEAFMVKLRLEQTSLASVQEQQR